MRLSSIGLIGGALLIGAVSVAPAFAGSGGSQASISGSTTFISPAGFTSTISGESVLPSGLIYNTLGATLTTSAVPGVKATLTNSAAIVLPQFSLQGFSVAAESLQVASSVAPTVPTSSASSFTGAAATILTNSAAATAAAGSLANGRAVGTVYFSANIEFISAIIKAGAGVNGLD